MALIPFLAKDDTVEKVTCITPVAKIDIGTSVAFVLCDTDSV